MDAHDPQGMALPAAVPPPSYPPHPHMEVRPHIPHHHHHHHHQSPIPFPPSQPSIPSSHPIPSDAAMSPAAAIHPPPFSIHYHHPHPHPHPHPHQTVRPAVYFTPEQQMIHTLFISGLPDDVKPREIHNLFCRRHGFSYCQLKYTGKGDQVVAFATFFNHQSAVAAMNALDGVTFDPQTGARLNVELARTNSRRNRPRGGEAYHVIDKRVKVPDDDEESESNDGDGGSDEPSGTDNPNSSNKAALAGTQSGELAGDLDNAQSTELSEKHTGEIPPCSTLFIANLGPSCTEEELNQALSKFTGFEMLKMRARGGMPVAFADFKEIEDATEAMNGLQGSLLPSSDRGGLHLEYARSKMRKTQGK